MSVRGLGTRARGCSLPSSCPPWVPAGGSQKQVHEIRLHLTLFLGLAPENTADAPPLGQATREQGGRRGGDSLQYVQKLLRPGELLAWPKPRSHMPDSDGLRTLVWLLELDVDVAKSEYLFPVTMRAHFWYSSLTFLLSRQCSRKRKKPCKQLRMEKA